MPKSSSIEIKDVFTIKGAQISEIYDKNKMSVHFQGMSKTLQFPHTIALQGAPTCSVGLSPDGLYNRVNNAGRLILMNQNAIQFASAPFVRIGGEEKEEVEEEDVLEEHGFFMLTRRDPEKVEGIDDVPALKNYYHKPVPEKDITISIATPSLEMVYKLGKISVKRRLVSPLFAERDQALMPLGVEEYEVINKSDEVKYITLVVPRPSLVNLQEKELKPTDQDTVYVCSAPVKGHVHKEFESDGIKGVVMASKECKDRMVIATPEMKGVSVDTNPYFCLNYLKQDLLLNDDGSFYRKRNPLVKQDYGAAISLTFKLKPKEIKTVPVVIALDFPVQTYIDGKKFERKYVKSFKNDKTRAVDMAKIALDNYKKWFDRTMTIQNRIYNMIRNSPSYKGDKKGALRLTRLICNEFSFPLSNGAVWVQDKNGKERARFLECFDYAYIDPSDVDWYSMVLLIFFPDIEKELCQSFINSINREDKGKKYYHWHASFVEAQQHFEDYPEEYEDKSLTQIYDQVKVKGAVSHDVGALPKGHPLRNVSEYAWYNDNYWVDLFPKLATRVLRNVKFTGDMDFLKKNWKTMKFGFKHLETHDHDGDGIPEGNPGEVKNTFDNLTLFGVDAYDATIFMAGCRAMIIMADMMKDTSAKKEYEKLFEKAQAEFEKLWREKKNKKGKKLEYYITCYDQETGDENTDTWLNQLDAIWALIAIGEEPFIPPDRAKKILKTIYNNNRTFMGWAMCRTEDGGKVESEQGQDVYTTSNYVFAELLDYYGLVKESKEVYKAMDKVIFDYANSLISPDNLRAELEIEAGETKPTPHYIVAAYPRPGAVVTQLVMQYIKDLQKKKKKIKISSKDLQKFIKDLMK
jgi:uncharacterized protein (DUF608 family)